MKLIMVLSIFLSLNLSAKVINKVIYGQDDRKDVYETQSELYKKLALSTAASFSIESLRDDGDTMTVMGNTLENHGKCSDIRFAKQMATSDCSGSLVGDQYILTAGHCVTSIEDCHKFLWAFGYANITAEQNSYTFPKTDVYKCTEIIERQGSYNDYALIKLDRPVIGREPLKYRTEGKIADRTPLVVIGHPSGLPTKVADGASVREGANTEAWFFQANLDTFVGNSGSAVFDATTGMIEGILVRGEQDYQEDSDNSCVRPFECKDDECRGEDVVRVTNVATLMTMEKEKAQPIK